MWSQYLEVGIGPDAEIFTKCQPMASVGTGADDRAAPGLGVEQPRAGDRARGQRRRPDRRRHLGNDVNLRDFEGRSALLLGKAKDNNGSCAIGPFLRLFDAPSRSTTCARAEVALEVRGPEGYVLNGSSSIVDDQPRPGRARRARRSAPPTSIRTGSCCFSARCSRRSRTATAPGEGFTHKLGDIVTIAVAKARRAGQPRRLQRPNRALGVRRAGADAQSRRPGPVVSKGLLRATETLPERARAWLDFWFGPPGDPERYHHKQIWFRRHA